MLDSEAKNRITGAPQGSFERACYAVMSHGDGTGTIVLDWYETSLGRDYVTSESFMRTEIDAARQIVRMLNEQLPGRVHAITEYEDSSEHESGPAEIDIQAKRKQVQRLSERIHERLIALLAQETREDQEAIVVELVLRDNLDENGGGNRSLKRRPVAKA
jgi:hypothetical protein